MYRNKKTGIIGVIITIIVLVVIVIISNIKIEDFSHIGGALSSFVMPVQNGITYIKKSLLLETNYIGKKDFCHCKMLTTIFKPLLKD